MDCYSHYLWQDSVIGGYYLLTSVEYGKPLYYIVPYTAMSLIRVYVICRNIRQ